MSDYDNTNRGALFVNDRKESENHPDSKGSINVGGVDYWISAWRKESAAGKKFLSLSVTPKDEQKPAPKKPVASRTPGEDDESDIPF